MFSFSLRPMRAHDTNNVIKWRNDPEVLRYLDSYKPLKREEHLQWLEGMQEDVSKAYMMIEVDGSPKGITWFNAIDHRIKKAELGIYLGEDRDNGYGTKTIRSMVTYGFEGLGLNKIYATVFDFNLRSLRCFEKCGFQREGVLRQETIDNGKYCDVIRVGLLKGEEIED